MQTLLDILQIDSTSGRERGLAEYLSRRFKTPYNELYGSEVGDGTLNLFFKWGVPRVVFCTHLDTVPPYIAPSVCKLPDGDVEIKGRGACDAKGQIYALWKACKALEERGEDGFGLLLLSGEETGSWGAKAFRPYGERKADGTTECAEYVIVAEPTDGRMVSASKGTKSFLITLKGKSFHSGYPEYGESAVDKFIDFVSELRGKAFAEDSLLGKTTWNIGKLESDNPQNVLSEEVRFRLYFRTTEASDKEVQEYVPQMVASFGGQCECYGGDSPMRYVTLEGFETTTVAFGSDAPQLSNFRKKILCGPGSILCAHRPDEHIYLSQLTEAAQNYVRMFDKLKQ